MRTGALILTPIDSVLLKTGAVLTRNPQQGPTRFYRYSRMKRNPQDTELS